MTDQRDKTSANIQIVEAWRQVSGPAVADARDRKGDGGLMHVQICEPSERHDQESATLTQQGATGHDVPMKLLRAEQL